MKQAQKEKLIADIEDLRRMLNSKVIAGKNVPKHCEQTYAISCQLDQLICQYMKTYND